jgi:fermentation-respiration switch protein FrsA (DUF1100 family)
MHMKRKRKFRQGVLLASGVGVMNGCGLVSRALIGGAPATIGPAPAALDAIDVSFASGSGSRLHGWFAPGRRGAGAVLLLHGVHANRLAMLPRARFLHDRGYAVLLPDFRAHGESTGDRTTFGALESRDALAAVCLLRTMAPGERIGVIGVSLGGAAALLGAAPLPADALVLESVYPTIDLAARNRLRAWLGPVGRLAAPAVVRWLTPAVGVGPEALRPIDHIGRLSVPVFVLAGSADRYTPITESRALFDRAPAPKEFWVVPGAAHVDLHDFAPAEYERRVGTFLERTLAASTVPAAAPACASGEPAPIRTTSVSSPR